MTAKLPLQIPPLRGWVLVAYRALMAALLLVTLPGIVQSVSIERELQRESRLFYQSGLRGGKSNAVIARVAPLSDQARASGVLVGDRLVAIDGTLVTPEAHRAMTALISGPDGSKLAVTLQTGDQPPRAVVLTRNSRYLDKAYAGSGLTFALRSWVTYGWEQADIILCAIIALILALRRSRDPVAAMLALGVVPFGASLYTLWPQMPSALGGALYGAFWTLLPLTILVFPSGQFAPRWTLWIVPLIVGRSLFSFASNWSESAQPLSQILYFVAWTAALTALVMRYRLTPAGTARQQIKFVLLGAAMWLACSAMSTGLLSLSLGTIDFATAAWLSLLGATALGLGNIGFNVGLLLALLRYRLYDAEALIGRSAGYAFLTVLLGAVFAGSEKVLEVLGEDLFGPTMRATSAGLGAAVAATLIAPLHGRVHRWTQRRFQQQLAALKSDLPKLVGDLREVATLDTLLATIVARIERGVRAIRAAVLLRDDDGFAVVRTSDISDEEVAIWRQSWQPRGAVGLDCDRDDPVFPIRVPLHADSGGMVGWILLGPRPDGSFYGKDERGALAEIADPIARAIDIVRQRDARRAEYKARDAALDRRLSLLETRLLVAGPPQA